MSVRLIIYDMLGRRVRVLHNDETLAAGRYRTAWNGLDDQGRPAASGVYLYRLKAGEDFATVGRMALIR
jgi:flagellar hook assembly protein FlgD